MLDGDIIVWLPKLGSSQVFGQYVCQAGLQVLAKLLCQPLTFEHLAYNSLAPSLISRFVKGTLTRTRRGLHEEAETAHQTGGRHNPKTAARATEDTLAAPDAGNPTAYLASRGTETPEPIFTMMQG